MRRAWAREEETEMKASFAASMQRGHLCSSCFLLARLARALIDIYNVFYTILVFSVQNIFKGLLRKWIIPQKMRFNMFQHVFKGSLRRGLKCNLEKDRKEKRDRVVCPSF